MAVKDIDQKTLYYIGKTLSGAGIDWNNGQINVSVDIPSVSLTTTAGNEKINVDSSSLSVVTRDTEQIIVGKKTLSNVVSATGQGTYPTKITFNGESGASKTFDASSIVRFPNWSRRTPIDFSTTSTTAVDYTPTEDGWWVFCFTTAHNQSEYTLKITIGSYIVFNNVSLYSYYGNDWGTGRDLFIPVQKGKRILVTVGAAGTIANKANYFFPCL